LNLEDLANYINSKKVESALPDAPIINFAKDKGVELGVLEKLPDGSVQALPTTLKNTEALRRSINTVTGYEPTNQKFSRDIKVVRARTMQDQFDSSGIDLQDKNSRNSDSLRGDNDYFFSHFKYAQKGIEVDEKGKVLLEILTAIKEVFPLQEEIDQGVFIGLLELHKLAKAETTPLPTGWMKDVLGTIKNTFKSSSLVHAKAKVQWTHVRPGASWSAPEAMSNFLREIYLVSGGTLNLPYHGIGSTIGIVEGNIVDGLIPESTTP
jgi:hypothetical protein